MANLASITRRYTGQDWKVGGRSGLPPEFLFLDPDKYPINEDVISFSRSIDPESLVVGVRSFFIEKEDKSLTAYIAWGLYGEPEINDVNGLHCVKIVPYLKGFGDGGSIEGSSSFLEISLVVAYA